MLVYSVETGKIVRNLEVDARRGVAVSSDQRWIATGWEQRRDGRDYAIVSINKTAKEMARTELTSWRPRDRGADRLLALDFAGGGKYLLAATSEVIRMWEDSTQ